jgi:hypothetical protein
MSFDVKDPRCFVAILSLLLSKRSLDSQRGFRANDLARNLPESRLRPPVLPIRPTADKLVGNATSAIRKESSDSPQYEPQQSPSAAR